MLFLDFLGSCQSLAKPTSTLEARYVPEQLGETAGRGRLERLTEQCVRDRLSKCPEEVSLRLLFTSHHIVTEVTATL